MVHSLAVEISNSSQSSIVSVIKRVADITHKVMGKPKGQCRQKEHDSYLALLAYRITPLSCGFSPAQLLMSRQLRSTLPDCRENILPKVPNKLVVENHDSRMKDQQKVNYDKRHGVRPSQPLSPGSPVWISD